MTIRMDDRVAVVTGAGAGLGRAYALLFASLGAKVVVNDLGVDMSGAGGDQSAADRVADEIRSAGGTATPNYGNVADEASSRAIIEAAVSQYGRIDILVNNAGILRDSSFAKMTSAQFEEVLRVHLFGGFYLTHAAWKHMVTQKYGRIVMTTSPAGTNGNFGQANYGAAKLGLVGLMNCLALEGPKNNVHVNAIAPGALTRMTENAPMGDLAQYLKPDLVAPAVAWLCSDRCNESGAIISAIGGYYSKVKYFEARGKQFDPMEPVTVDMIDAAYDEIMSPEGAVPVEPGPLGGIVERLTKMGRL